MLYKTWITQLAWIYVCIYIYTYIHTHTQTFSKQLENSHDFQTHMRYLKSGNSDI